MKKYILVGALTATCLLAGNYKACTGCHGQYFEKRALSQSKVVANMSKEEIKKALDGYKNGTYGGPMKNMMKTQVASIENTDKAAEEIYNLSHFKKTEFKKFKSEYEKKIKKLNICVEEARKKSDIDECMAAFAKKR